MPLVVMEDRSRFGLDGRAQGRIAAVQDNVRAALFNVGSPTSSVYSGSPNVQPSPPLPTSNSTTKSPMMRPLFGLLQRTGNTPILRHMPNFQNPFASREHADVYSPATQPTEWGRSPMPAQLSPLPVQPSPIAHSEFRHPADALPITNQPRDLEAALPPRRKRSKRKHRRHQGQWTRKRKIQGGSRTCSALFQGPTRTKAIATAVSGSFLVTVLTMCKFVGVYSSEREVLIIASRFVDCYFGQDAQPADTYPFYPCGHRIIGLLHPLALPALTYDSPAKEEPTPTPTTYPVHRRTRGLQARCADPSPASTRRRIWRLRRRREDARRKGRGIEASTTCVWIVEGKCAARPEPAALAEGRRSGAQRGDGVPAAIAKRLAKSL